MKIYICSDIHNQFNKFIPEEKVDLILCAGDITNKGGYIETIEAHYWMKQISLNPTTMLYVPGNHDKNWHFSNRSDCATNVLGKRFTICNTLKLLCGASMSVCYKAPDLAVVWDNMTCNPEVEKAYYESIPPCDILLSHSPPSGPTGFCLDNRQDFGSVELRKWIEKNQPALVVCGHIHNPQAREEMIGKTRVINTATIGQVIEL
jgi:Icc-related predicted phosphoesterase